MIRFLHNLFLHDWPLKLFSLALAVLTWLAVSFSLRQHVEPVPGVQSLSEKTCYDVPVSIVSRNADVSRFKAEPQEVDVTFQGSEAALKEMSRASVRVIVDLTGTILNSPQELPVEVIAPAGITHVGIKPANLVRIIPPPAQETKTSTNNSQ